MLACLLSTRLSSGQSQSAPEKEASEMIRQIYKEVSGVGDERPNWDRVRSYFVDEAIIVLRTSREGSTQFTLEEFIQDFQDFYKSQAVGDAGFKEEVIQLKLHLYHDIAFAGVIYEAKVLESDRPPSRGIDFWSLIRKGDSWKVVSVTNEVIRPGEALPPPFE